MKKALIIFLSLALALSLAACSGGDGGKAPSGSPSSTESSKTPSDEARSDENRYYGIGEAAEANGLSVTLDKVAVAEANTTLEKAKDGFEYIKVWFTFKNISNETIESPKAKAFYIVYTEGVTGDDSDMKSEENSQVMLEVADRNERYMYFHRKRIDKDKRGRWYAFFECSTSVSRRYEHCTAHYTRQDKLEADVLSAIQLQVKAALDYDKLLDKLRGSEGEKNIRDKQNALITSLNLKLSGVSKKRTRLYEDFAEGFLDEEEYTFAKKSYDEQFADLSRRLDETVQRRSKFNEAMSVDNKWITLMKSVSTATQLSQNLVDESVELVKVHEGGAVELVMKYGDIYALTVQSIKEVQEAKILIFF